VEVAERHEGRRRRCPKSYDVATLRGIRPVHLASSVLVGAAAVLLAATGAYARSESASAVPAPNGEDGPNLVVVTVAAGIVALVLLGGFFVVRYAWVMYKSKS
jgi:hypothetical protein